MDMAVENEVERRPKKNLPGPRVTIPDGTTMEEITRKGLAFEEANGAVLVEAAAHIGIGRHAYRLMRDLVLLHDHGGLNVLDTMVIKDAMAEMNRERRISDVYEEMIKPIADKVWGEGIDASPRAVREEKRLQAFETRFGIVLNTCASAAELDLPYLTADRAKKAIREIHQARRELAMLLDRLKRIHGNG